MDESKDITEEFIDFVRQFFTGQMIFETEEGVYEKKIVKHRPSGVYIPKKKKKSRKRGK